MHEELLLALAGINLIAIACQWLAWRLKLPAILFLLMAGIVAGPVTGWLEPDRVFGPLLFPIISLAVAVILFEGSLTLRFREIQGLQTVVRRLVTTGVLVTWVIIALATHYLVNFSWALSFLFGALTVVTGPTVIVPLLRTVRPTANIANILRWEGIVIDPVGALLSVLVFQFIISEAGSSAVGQTLIAFVKALLLGSLIGCASGFGFGQIIRNHWLPEYLHNIATLALVCGVFVAANAVQHESGLLAVTVMGIWLANMKRVPMEDIVNFKESLSILLISGLFIILAARVDFSRFIELGWGAAGVFLVVQFVARPIKTLLAAWGTPLTWRERLLIAWIAPRGIVAAATAAVFAIRLQDPRFHGGAAADDPLDAVMPSFAQAQAELLVPLTFMVIMGTVVLQSATARFIALRLGVAEPEARGFLIVGANALSRAIAKALRECGYSVLLASSSWGHIRAARMEGLDTYYGNVVSDHADQHLDLVGFGHLLALSQYPDANQLACQRYVSEFGRAAVYSVQAGNHGLPGATSRFAREPAGRKLFDPDIDIQGLLEMLNGGAKVHKTILTERHSFQDFLDSHPERTIPLFAVNPRNQVKFFTVDNKPLPKADWTLVSLVPAAPCDNAQPLQPSGVAPR